MTLSTFFKKLGIRPKNVNLFYDALTHTSFVNEKRVGNSYQRLEFVGDSLLDVAVAFYLYQETPKLSEGEMTVIRASAVKAESLAEISKELGLDKLIRIGKGAQNLKTNTKILSDIFESVSAAIYIDMGKDVFLNFLEQTLFTKLAALKGQNLKNAKTILQEYLQADSRANIVYETRKKMLGDETEIFETSVSHNDIVLGIGRGKNTKIAEVEAAKDALEKWKGENETD